MVLLLLPRGNFQFSNDHFGFLDLFHGEVAVYHRCVLGYRGRARQRRQYLIHDRYICLIHKDWKTQAIHISNIHRYHNPCWKWECGYLIPYRGACHTPCRTPATTAAKSARSTVLLWYALLKVLRGG